MPAQNLNGASNNQIKVEQQTSVLKSSNQSSTNGSANQAGMLSLFRNKRFMLNLMLQRNASKFTIFLQYENLRGFFICATLFFSLMNALVRPEHLLGGKIK